jgi:hypothetical protein
MILTKCFNKLLMKQKLLIEDKEELFKMDKVINGIQIRLNKCVLELLHKLNL